MTDIDIKAISERADAATPGPWVSGCYNSVSTPWSYKICNTDWWTEVKQ